MTEPKLYGIERADGTVSQEANRIGCFASMSHEYCEPGERVVEIVAVKKERLEKLEALANLGYEVAREAIGFIDEFPMHSARSVKAKVSEFMEAIAALRSGR